MSKIRRSLLVSNSNKSDKGYFIGIARNTISNNNVCFSFDSGSTWTYKTINNGYSFIRISQDLNKMVISGYDGKCLYSLDRGTTFNDLPIRMDYATISNDGNVITGCTSRDRKTYILVYPFTSYTQIFSST